MIALYTEVPSCSVCKRSVSACKSWRVVRLGLIFWSVDFGVNCSCLFVVIFFISLLNWYEFEVISCFKHNVTHPKVWFPAIKSCFIRPAAAATTTTTTTTISCELQFIRLHLLPLVLRGQILDADVRSPSNAPTLCTPSEFWLGGITIVLQLNHHQQFCPSLSGKSLERGVSD